MQKINFQDLPSTTTPINASNLNLLQSNVENAINLVGSASSVEKQIGTYSGKPLYRKYFYTSLPSNEDTNDNIITLTDVKFITNMYGSVDTIFSGSNYSTQVPINYYLSSSDYVSTWALGNVNNVPTAIRCRQHGHSGAQVRIVIEYTKTTD